jgi:hypothetical protein
MNKGKNKNKNNTKKENEVAEETALNEVELQKELEKYLKINEEQNKAKQIEDEKIKQVRQDNSNELEKLKSLRSSDDKDALYSYVIDIVKLD